jgi:DNA-directed RNA polymerase specialized sigma24 family protein
MDEVDDQDDPRDPEDAGGEHATLDDVGEALERFGPKDWRRIELIGRRLAVGTSLDAGDLVNTAVERLLLGKRHWHRKETIVACFGRTMKSIVKDWWRRKQMVEIVTEADAPLVEDEDGDETGVVDRARSDDADPERVLIARRALDEVRAALEDDKDTWEIALAVAVGETPEDIRYAYELTKTQYDSALKRIRRALTRVRPPGDRT